MQEKTVVSVLPYNSNGEVLLQLRDDKPGLAYANHWTLFGGQMEAGETPDESMRREVREELDIELPLRYWQTFECPVRTRPGELRVLNRVYVAEMHHDIATLTLHEGQRMGYFGAEDAVGMTLAFEQQNILQAFFKSFNRIEQVVFMPEQISAMTGLQALAAMFAAAKAQGRAAFLPYFPIGYPTYEQSLNAIGAMAAEGVDGFEIGMPFSDPLADGPVIQAATQVALENGITVRKCLEAVRELRGRGVTQPMLMMGYLNPMLAYGIEKFVQDAKAAGANGVIVPDLPPEEAALFADVCAREDMALILFLAPTSSNARVDLVAQQAKGFIYVVSLTGVTGARRDLPPDLTEFIQRLKDRVHDVPLVLGFGIGTPEQAKLVNHLVDGFIVGSALVRAGKEGVDSVRTLAGNVRRALED